MRNNKLTVHIDVFERFIATFIESFLYTLSLFFMTFLLSMIKLCVCSCVLWLFWLLVFQGKILLFLNHLVVLSYLVTVMKSSGFKKETSC